MTTITLRTKAISGARCSFYLDYYPPIPHPVTGKPTRREFLGLYLLAPHSFNRKHNEETQAIAEGIRAKRYLEKGKQKRTNYDDEDFLQHFRNMANKRGGNWMSAYMYIENFTGGTLKFANLNENFCNNFREYLLTTRSLRSDKYQLSHNSAVSYFAKFKAFLRQVFKDGYLQTDLNSRVKAIAPLETHREFLTLEELQALVKTDCKFPIVKQAALFSAITGLRFSDIQKLVWGEVRSEHEAAPALLGGIEPGMEFHYLKFTQKKTKSAEILPISQQAYSLLGIRGELVDNVFTALKYSAYMNILLKKWVLKAGIKKDITFHCFRHTFATLQLSKGTDIYTVSKMLGHRELKTTQGYAKIIDKTKREAANKIQLDF